MQNESVGVKSEHRDCGLAPLDSKHLTGWRRGEDSALCPTEVFTSLDKGRGGRDRAKNNSFLKNSVRCILKNKFFARMRTHSVMAHFAATSRGIWKIPGTKSWKFFEFLRAKWAKHEKPNPRLAAKPACPPAYHFVAQAGGQLSERPSERRVSLSPSEGERGIHHQHSPHYWDWQNWHFWHWPFAFLMVGFV